MLRKVVLTGTACSGKSTLLNEMRKLGYPIIEEAAREIIRERRHLEVTEKENLTRQYLMLSRQNQREEEYESLNKNGNYVFLDRGLVDIAAYCLTLLGGIPKDIEISAKSSRYDLVLFLERLPFEEDGIRLERIEEERERIEKNLKDTYVSYGYSPIFVPKMSLPERIEFVLSNIQNGMHRKNL